MVCKKGQTICNPTVFGLELPKECNKLADCAADAKPLCVPTGAWPTESCYHKSTFREALVAAEIIDSDSVQYDRFIKNFADLCDDEQIEKNSYADPEKRMNKKVTAEAVRKDIKITCGWAKKKMKSVYEVYKIPSPDDRNEWVKEKELKSQK